MDPLLPMFLLAQGEDRRGRSADALRAYSCVLEGAGDALRGAAELEVARLKERSLAGVSAPANPAVPFAHASSASRAEAFQRIASGCEVRGDVSGAASAYREAWLEWTRLRVPARSRQCSDALLALTGERLEPVPVVWVRGYALQLRQVIDASWSVEERRWYPPLAGVRDWASALLEPLPEARRVEADWRPAADADQEGVLRLSPDEYFRWRFANDPLPIQTFLSARSTADGGARAGADTLTPEREAVVVDAYLAVHQRPQPSPIARELFRRVSAAGATAALQLLIDLEQQLATVEDAAECVQMHAWARVDTVQQALKGVLGLEDVIVTEFLLDFFLILHGAHQEVLNAIRSAPEAGLSALAYLELRDKESKLPWERRLEVVCKPSSFDSCMPVEERAGAAALAQRAALLHSTFALPSPSRTAPENV